MTAVTEVVQVAAPAAHQSRWGFHPCDRETSRKLRFLNRAYQSALAKAAAWRRWERKAAHNRVARPRVRDASGRVVGYGPPVPLGEPGLCPVFSERKPGTESVWGTRTDGTRGFIDRATGRDVATVDDRGIPAAARLARWPRAAPESVIPLPLTVEEIDRLYAAAGGR